MERRIYGCINRYYKERFGDALVYFDAVYSLDVVNIPPFDFFWGEALLREGRKTESLKTLYGYLEKSGSEGKYYSGSPEVDQ